MARSAYSQEAVPLEKMSELISNSEISVHLHTPDTYSHVIWLSPNGQVFSHAFLLPEQVSALPEQLRSAACRWSI